MTVTRPAVRYHGGYSCALYDDLYSGWQRVDQAAHADGAKDRVESLWLSPNCRMVSLF